MNVLPENSPALQRWDHRRENQLSPARDGRGVLSSLAGLVQIHAAYPSAEALGYFQSSAETQHLARHYQKKQATLEALKKSLLHQAFTGEL